MLRGWTTAVVAGAWLAAHAGCSAAEPASTAPLYHGLSDASAAVALSDQFFVAADDENNVLKIYSTTSPGREVAALDWSANLGISPLSEFPEADIEGATILGNYIFWITSHGRSRTGKWRPNRHRLFAMTIDTAGGRFAGKPVGLAYQRLAEHLLRLPQANSLGVAAALGPLGSNDRALAPKDEGLNIEGLTVTADGKSLLIGFRNPVPHGKALLLALLNPVQVIMDQAAPQFGQPVLLDLSVQLRKKSYALGIRSIEYSPAHGDYLIAAGPLDTKNVFALFRWSGKTGEQARLLAATASVLRVKDFAPEAIIVYADGDQIQLLSDDGTQTVRVASPAECVPGEYKNGQCQQKYLRDPARRWFRSLRLQIP